MSIQVVSFNCLLKNSTGQFISSTYNRDVLSAQPGDPGFLKGLAIKMQNLVMGEKRSIELSAEEAYGFYDPKKIILFPIEQLSRNIFVGETIRIAAKGGRIRSYRVIHLHGTMATLDFNHPLAGQDLIFEIDVISARDALDSEIAEAADLNPVNLLH